MGRPRLRAQERLQEEDGGRQEGVPQGAGRLQGEPGVEGRRRERGHVRRLRQLQLGGPPVRRVFPAGHAALAADVLRLDAALPAAADGEEGADEHEHEQSGSAAPEYDTVAHGASAKPHEHAAYAAAARKRLHATGEAFIGQTALLIDDFVVLLGTCL